MLAPGPGHSTADRSLSVKLDSGAPDGFIVNSFANDDPIACRGLCPREVLNSRLSSRMAAAINIYQSDTIERAVMAAAGTQSRNDKPKGRVVATYDYTDADGKPLYQVLHGTNRKIFDSDGRMATADGFGN